MKALEEPIERHSPDLVRDVASDKTLERVRLEQTSVQEGDRPKSSGPTSPLGDGSVECSEEERLEEVPVHAVSSGQATIDLLTHESLSSAEPALCLNEVEEQNASELKEGKRVSVFPSEVMTEGRR